MNKLHIKVKTEAFYEIIVNPHLISSEILSKTIGDLTYYWIPAILFRRLPFLLIIPLKGGAWWGEKKRKDKKRYEKILRERRRVSDEMEGDSDGFQGE